MENIMRNDLEIRTKIITVNSCVSKIMKTWNRFYGKGYTRTQIKEYRDYLKTLEPEELSEIFLSYDCDYDWNTEDEDDGADWEYMGSYENQMLFADGFGCFCRAPLKHNNIDISVPH